MKYFLIILLFISFSAKSQQLFMLQKDSVTATPPCGTNNGTTSGGSWSGGQFLFDGSGSKIVPASDITVGTTAAISFKFTPGTFSTKYLFSADPSVDVSGYNYIRFDNSTTIFIETVAFQHGTFTVPTLSAGTEYTCTINVISGTYHLYINGTESSSGGQAFTSNIIIHQVGVYYTNTGGYLANSWDGKMREFYYFSTSLSGTDISNLAAGSAPVTTPVTHWKLNEGSGTLINDYCTN